MLFNSYQFMIFFPIVLLLYFVVPKKLREVWLLIASLYFYMSWNVRYVVLILFSITVTYLSGILMERVPANKRKLVVALSFTLNLLVLFFFKYFDFTLDNINAVLGRFGVTAVNKPFDVILPVGISFYTFQALSYTVDVYRGDIKAEKNFIRYALFVSFFPQLVAGPIERSKNLLSQFGNLAERKLWNFDRIRSGAIMMAWGYFLKMVIADRISILVDGIFDEYYLYGTITLIIGAVAFAIQIYCDFMSYSTIAIGAAKVLGFELMENFDTPYLAMSIKEFWRRWHISLSTWFRDYLYIPLGGSRCSKVRKYFNLMVTFLASGLWHGADWTYVIWGGLHGIYQIIGDMLAPVRKKLHAVFGTKENSFSYKLACILGTFALADFAWIFFRADSIENAFGYIGRMFTHFDPWVLTDESIYTLGLPVAEMHILLVSLLALIAVSLYRYITSVRLDVFVAAQAPWFQILFMYIVIMAIVVFGKYGPSEEMKAFIYFQF